MFAAKVGMEIIHMLETNKPMVADSDHQSYPHHLGEFAANIIQNRIS